MVKKPEVSQKLSLFWGEYNDKKKNYFIIIFFSEKSDLVDLHPEKRMKAAFTAYEERRLKELKIEKPSLRLSQLKQMIFKEWQKSPENPLNSKEWNISISWLLKHMNEIIEKSKQCLLNWTLQCVKLISLLSLIYHIKIAEK